MATLGRPKKQINDDHIQSLISSGLNKTRISEVLEISRAKLNRYLSEHHLEDLFLRHDLASDEIDDITKRAKAELPSFGERMTIGYFRASSIRLTRAQIRASIHRVDPDGVVSCREDARRRICRRVYSSPYPHYMWHIDGNHKLIRWHMVIHIGIDGFSRACVFMKCSDNNCANTVLEAFGQALEEFNVSPTRIRSDHGGENVKIWEAMLNHRSEANPNPVVVGSSVHNQRVERFNREVNRHIRDKYAAIFYRLEENDLLNVDSNLDLFCLHYIYLPRVNKTLSILRLSHNQHAVSNEGNQSPMQLIASNWHRRQNMDNHYAVPGQLITTVAGIPLSPFSMRSIENPLTEEVYSQLRIEVDPFREDHADGVQLYKAAKFYVRAHCT